MSENSDEAIGRFQQAREAVETMRLAHEQCVEAAIMQAKIAYAAFRALTAEGFSESQAIEIIKARGPMLA